MSNNNVHSNGHKQGKNKSFLGLVTTFMAVATLGLMGATLWYADANKAQAGQDQQSAVMTLPEIDPHTIVPTPLGALACKQAYIDPGTPGVGGESQSAQMGWATNQRLVVLPDGTAARVDCSKFNPS